MSVCDENVFSNLSDDVVLNILFKLEDDPRHLARLACVCTKFCSLIRNVCWKTKCSQAIPSVVADLFSGTGDSSPPGSWAALHKLSVCCPGLLHSGVLLENSDFGLERELGPDEDYRKVGSCGINVRDAKTPSVASSSHHDSNSEISDSCSWSLFDDLYYDTLYDVSETVDETQTGEEAEKGAVKVGRDLPVPKRRRICRPLRSHLASGVWNLSREQGSKLLASRFRGDSLYICDWPGCLHMEEKRNYMLFRGVFKNFKRSRVWRTINDGKRNKIDLNCAFCPCKETWDLLSSFCLRRVFGFHDDGEPVVRAYVCENGHVSGAWTDWPLYT